MNLWPKTTALICFSILGAIPVERSAVLFENDQVKVLRAFEAVHVKSKFHEHTRNRVMIYLQAGRQRFTHPDGTKEIVSDWKAGQVEWTPAAGLHSAEVISNDPFNIIEVELKSPGTGKAVADALDPVKIDPRHYKVEFENDSVRVLRARIEAHGVAPMHRHSLKRVTVFLTDQDFRVTDAKGNISTVKHKAGDAIWGEPLEHKEENVSDQPFEVIAVELKG